MSGSEPTLRLAHGADALGIAQIWNQIIRDTAITFTTVEKSSDDIAALIETQPVWVAASGSTILGFATYGPFRSGPGYAHTVEHSVYLSEDARGHGLGRKLMALCQVHARETGAHVMVAGLAGANHKGQAFHRKLGFEEVGRLPQVGRKFDQWQDLVLMQKML